MRRPTSFRTLLLRMLLRPALRHASRRVDVGDGLAAPASAGSNWHACLPDRFAPPAPVEQLDAHHVVAQWQVLDAAAVRCVLPVVRLLLWYGRRRHRPGSSAGGRRTVSDHVYEM